MNYGFKVSKTGYDVKTAADKDMILTSKYPFLKAYAQGVISLTITSTSIFTSTITHSFGYHPAYIFLGVYDPNFPTKRYLGNFYVSGGPFGSLRADSYTTTNTLVIGWQDTSAEYFHAYPYTVYMYYYLFYDKLN